MTLVTITHRTTYRYAAAVSLGRHRMMLRPRPSSDLRVVDSRLLVTPAARITQSRDSFGNAIDWADFSNATHDLSIISVFRVLHSPRSLAEIARAASSRWVETPPELHEFLRPDDGLAVTDWAQSLRRDCRGMAAFDIATIMTGRIHDDFVYARRDAPGTQDPDVTLRLGSGTCRDFAWLMVQACRRLGLPARFASGYLYDEDAPADDMGEALVGGGVTHAWAQVHLGGAGWVCFDPTNDLIGGRNLILSSVGAEPAQTMPCSGTFEGRIGDFLGLDVRVDASCRSEAHPARTTAASSGSPEVRFA